MNLYKQFACVLYAGILTLCMVPMAEVVVIDREGGFIYDDGQDFSWTQNANI